MKKIFGAFLTLSTLAFGAADDEMEFGGDPYIPAYLLEKQDLYLVVGSRRAQGTTPGPLIDRIVGHGSLLHTQTFDGRATTMDVEPSFRSDLPHIIGDASACNFEGYNIPKVYIERPPTSNRLVENMILNLRDYMIIGQSTLEIEWDPYCRAVLDTVDVEQLYDQNPFDYYWRFGYELKAIEDHVNNRAHSDMIAKLLTFYAANSHVSLNKIKKRLSCEIKLAYECIAAQKEGLGVFIKNDIYTKFGTLEKEKLPLKKIPILQPEILGCLAFKGEGSKISFMSDNHPEANRTKPSFLGRVHTFETFFANSSLHYLLSDMGVYRQTPNVIAYMQNHGFAEVTVERKTSPHNGRTNVWIVSGRYVGLPHWSCSIL